MAFNKDFNLELASSKQLDIIDKLRELGVGDHVALPQLIVVGDQSSGKSSVLEAVSELPFARDSGLCTRFATEIMMRRTEVESISVSIIPASGASGERAEKLRRFKKDGLKTLNGEEFLKIFKDACTAMGVSTSAGPPAAGQVTFSADMLKIELTGPTRQNLSMIDIPGIFRNPTPGVTTKDDINLINNMVRNFMKDERAIILAVLGANVDLATQEILTLRPLSLRCNLTDKSQMAEEADPKGIRTLGILTKPDLVNKGAEKNVIDLVRGKSGMKLRLGYCIVRNRAQNELSSTTLERATKEKEFFNNAPWSAVEKDRAGINSLKARLQELLGEITSRERPKVKQQIDRQLSSARKQLNDLGQDRETSDQQRRFLQEIAGHFQKITDHALDAYYSRGVVFDKIPELRLPTLVIDRSDTFNNDILNFGHAVEFSISGEPEEDYDKEKGTQIAGAKGTSVKIDPENTEQWLVMPEGKFQDYPELSDLVSGEPYSLHKIPEDVLSWIKGVYLNTRGCGLDSISPAVLPALWQEQSRNWDGITRKYIGDIIVYVHDFIDKLLREVCPDERTRKIFFWCSGTLFSNATRGLLNT